MKKYLIAIILSGLSAGTFAAVLPANQETTTPSVSLSPGGFNDPAPDISSVVQAQKLWDDEWVSLKGNIIKQTGHNLYEFRDDSGTINIRIHNRDWMGLTVSPENIVLIEGKIDRHWNERRVDVKNIQILK